MWWNSSFRKNQPYLNIRFPNRFQIEDYNCNITFTTATSTYKCVSGDGEGETPSPSPPPPLPSPPSGGSGEAGSGTDALSEECTNCVSQACANFTSSSSCEEIISNNQTITKFVEGVYQSCKASPNTAEWCRSHAVKYGGCYVGCR